MNYLSARQRQSDEKWDYTYNGAPYGYCREYFDPDNYKTWIREHMTPAEVEKIRSFEDKYHTHGHDTKEEACQCYKEYMLDHRLRLDGKDNSCQRKCEKCGEWTQGFAEVGCYQLWFLCDEHRNREVVSELYKVGESWES